MRHAWLIDPFAQTVERVDLHAAVSSVDELHEIYTLLDCQTLESIAPLNADGDRMLIDEDGKINGRHQEYFFCRLWPHDPLAGRALWVGRNAEGDITSPKRALEYVRGHIAWSLRI
jgi:hypothetical protein